MACFCARKSHLNFWSIIFSEIKKKTGTQKNYRLFIITNQQPTDHTERLPPCHICMTCHNKNARDKHVT